MEVDAALGIAYELEYYAEQQGQVLGDRLIQTFKILCGMIGE